MKIAILVVGRLKDRYLEDGIDEYLKRIRRFGKCEIIRIREENKPNRSAESAAKEKEADRIRQQLKPGDHLIALTEEGDLHDSPQLAQTLDGLAMRTPGRIVFVIGSGPGLADSIKRDASTLLSLSPLTFPHQMALLFLVEQIYRAYTILNHQPYHR